MQHAKVLMATAFLLFNSQCIGKSHSENEGYKTGGAVKEGEEFIYMADSFHNVIWKILPDGSRRTYAGRLNHRGLNNAAKNYALFNTPRALAVDRNNNVYVADENNNVIRLIDNSGFVKTIAGVGGSSGYKDGMASASVFNHPRDVAIGDDGSIYVADTDNYVIRRISKKGTVSTILGTYDDDPNDLDHGGIINHPVNVAFVGHGVLVALDDYGLLVSFDSDGNVFWKKNLFQYFHESINFNVDSRMAEDGNGNLVIIDSSGKIYIFVGDVRKENPDEIKISKMPIGNDLEASNVAISNNGLIFVLDAVCDCVKKQMNFVLK